MEVKVKRPRGRPRKRKRPEDENVVASDKRHGFFEVKPIPFVGRYVLREFVGNGVYLGKIVYYESGLYRVDYEEGDCEDLDSRELRQFLLGEKDFDDELSRRKVKLDEWILKRSIEKKQDDLEKKDRYLKSQVDKVEVSVLSDVSGGLMVEDDEELVEGDVGSSSDSCEHVHDMDASLEAEVPQIPPLQLPQSSWTIGVPEEYVSQLFSVYGFLRSFGIRLFLSPFGLDDFVGSLNCCVPNTLMDAIHVSLMRVLRRNLEALSSDGSELALNCLRCIDWSLLDTLTWPVYLVQYLTLMGYTKGPEWKGFYNEALEREYYSLSTGRKLMILQILCDDALDCEEIRAEIDMREGSEVGIDPDAVVSNAPENGSRRVHSRYSKTSTCKGREAVEITAGSNGTKSAYVAMDVDAPDDDMDGNGNECCICGMDGTLLCCDGCPSVYHTRCIGVAKMYIPEGSWYCPECTINKMGLIITTGTTLRGAEVFGIDSYGQVFLGTCNYLLVLSSSNNTEPYIRFYNPVDIPMVLQVLLSSAQHVSLYLGICRAIIQYWGIPEGVVDPLGVIKADEKFCSLSLHPPIKESYGVTDMVEAQNASSNPGSNEDNVTVSSLGTFVDTMAQTNLPVGQSNSLTVAEKTNMKLQGHIKMESNMSTGSITQQAEPSDLTYHSLVERSSAIEFMTCTSRISNENYHRPASSCLPANIPFQSKEGNYEDFLRGERNSAGNFALMGTNFKTQAYINQYMHGDFAAAAAAKLAVLSSEESHVSEALRSGNGRKVISGSILMQAKAFSSTASRFFWPSPEKKLWEVPRERCSWCYSCKVQASSKRGCMLNSAITIATKTAMKFFNGLHPLKLGEGSLSTIAAYILYMEESLCGLMSGFFLSSSHRNRWHKQVQEASTVSMLKALLLELEENICLIALSGEWIKLMDDWLVDSTMIQSASCNVGTRKCGPGRKRGRKQSGISEDTADDSRDQSFSWWQGGKSTDVVFQKAILPCSMVRTAARRGGVRKLSNVNYADGSVVPKRSRQLVWRAAVARCKTTSQLALQVRYLDLHVRWSDLARPDQNLQDGKCPETEASAFRNAIICDKKILESKIRYGVIFGNQKHFPSRVMKSVIEIEQNQDAKEKYWFPETRIPLYLIKEYEESKDKVIFASAKKPPDDLSELQKKQLKASRKDMFSYLVCKRDKLEKCACASCHLDVLLGNAVKCSACQGYCHERCTVSSMYTNGVVKPLITCNQCYHVKFLGPSEVSSESPTSPLPLQLQEYQTAVTVTKVTRSSAFNQPLACVRTQESCSEVKKATNSGLATKTQSKTLSWGIIWKKKNIEDTGAAFRKANILVRGSSNEHGLRPVCYLCQLPYNSDLMYIHCETCQRWFHAEAVELEESRLSDVIGFKCCKCRRIGGPECPYMDPELKEKKRKNRRLRAQKQGQGTMRMESDIGTSSESKGCKPSTPMCPIEEVSVPNTDPLPFSLSSVELIKEPNSGVGFGWNAAGSGPQKLPVRRQVKCDEDINGGSIGNNLSQADVSMHIESNKVMNPVESAALCMGWDTSANGLESDSLFDIGGLSYEDMEFEPQTYFSLSELLATDDGGTLDGTDASGVLPGNQGDLSFSSSQDIVPEPEMGTSNDQHSNSTVNTKHC
ncbi:DDT domain-containing protein PTM-like [Mangifera indica]|uniref:DDT domain-containing protein PTM-like n=1 Tax=Mangifera indica TaxID=29780 RepID=UPI001CFB5AA3|nr:DDT domain-containing protein PTM-like [Mangifera indica]